MIIEGETSTGFLNESRKNVGNENAWVGLVESQTAPSTRLELLEKAVATVPTSSTSRRASIKESLPANANPKIDMKLSVYLQDLLSIFPDQRDMWDLIMQRYPSIETFNTALKYVENDIVWPQYSKYSLNANNNLTDDERFSAVRLFIEADWSQSKNIIGLIIQSGMPSLAERLILWFRTPQFDVWNLVIPQSQNVEFLTAAHELFSVNDNTQIVIRLSQALLLSGGNFVDARRLIFEASETCSSVSKFCSLFRAATASYEYTVTHMGQAPKFSKDAFAKTRSISEYGNLIAKRSRLLSETATREFPNNVQAWSDRAALWQNKPHIAADVLETAINTVDPILAAGMSYVCSDMSDLYIRYAELLQENGASHEEVKSLLSDVTTKPFVTPIMKSKSSVALSRLIREVDTDGAIEALEKAFDLPTLEGKYRQKLWFEYFTVLVNNKVKDSSKFDTDSDKLLAAFSRACISREITMFMAISVARAFPVTSSNYITVFEQAISLFPVPMVLPSWKNFSQDMNGKSSPARLRGLYNTALTSFRNDKQGYEELVLSYFDAECTWSTGSMVLARQRLVHTLRRSVNPRIWKAYIATSSDITSRREAYEEAINLLNPESAHQLALEFGALEEELGQTARSREIYEFASQIEQQYLQEDQMVSMDDEKSIHEVRFVPAMT